MEFALVAAVINSFQQMNSSQIHMEEKNLQKTIEFVWSRQKFLVCRTE